MDFANILFGGPCNRACPFCIGKQLPAALGQNNLRIYPLRKQDEFVRRLQQSQVRQIVFTGTNTDPQLYRYEERLLNELRGQLPGAQFCLHSNGALALRKIDVFNRYDRVCLSFPTFEADLYQQLMGSPRVPDLAEILRHSRVPVKISALAAHVSSAFLDRLRELGVQRVVLRRLYGIHESVQLPQGLNLQGSYRGNPVYDWRGLEVTDWTFDTCESTSLNLFPDGTISPHYLLTRAS
ncbi:MAG: radical SAM protein [Candidatus Eremiobacteraeota bacterium]|nr:radical SAM protein [Candidatus Eremiobacteraeota bacterium]